MTVRVLLLGASRYYSRSIQSVRDAGFYTIVADRYSASPGFLYGDQSFVCDIIDEVGIEKICSETGVDVIIPLNDYGVLTASRVSQRLGLPGISESTAIAATNKEKMREIWSKAGLPCPKYEVEAEIKKLHESIKRIGFPCILKPAHGIGGGSRGVSVIFSESEISRALSLAQNAYAENAVIVEEFIPGRSEHSCEILMSEGQVQVIAIGDKVKSQLPYRVDKSVIYPTILSEAEKLEVEELARLATTTLGLSVGTAHLEFSMTENGPVLFEIGARCGGGATPEPIVAYITGLHLVVEHVRALLGESRLPIPILTQGGCVYRFLFGREGEVKSVSGWPPQTNDGILLDSEMLVGPGDQIRDVKNGTDRIGFMVVGGSNREAAISMADMLEQKIEIEVC